MELTLDTPIQNVPLVGPSRASGLLRLGIFTVEDLLYHIPHRYNDYSQVTPISQTKPGETVTIKATIEKISTFRTKNGKQLIQATIVDTTGKLLVVWFNQTYLLKILNEGDEVSFSGSIQWFGNKKSLSNPQFEVISSKKAGDTLHTGRLVAVYPETEGITSKWLRNRIHYLLQQKEIIVDELPESVKNHEQLPNLTDALQHVHFPSSMEEAELSKKRLAFDELLFFQIRAKQQKRLWETTQKAPSITISQELIHQFISALPFTLTDDQQTVIQELQSDIERSIPMNRLMVGDVGSGKTIVAAFAMYAAYRAGYSSVLMAPTQILAEQHYATISRILNPMGISVDLMTGSTKTITSETAQTVSLFTSDQQKLVVGTHALLSNQDKLGNIGVVIIDEQHRFGVRQRGILTEMQKNGHMPHLLTMTATPIPRTLAKTLFGNVDLSFLLTMPTGRQRIKTWLVPNEKRKNSYTWIEEQIKQGGQVFIICPLIDTSESLTTVKAVTDEYQQLTSIFPTLSIGLLHGRMKPKEKTDVLDAFRDKKHHILLATPVVEVGIDIPNATVIVIETAERFGLGQLHQLRGRVGRSEKQSYCLLFTETEEERAYMRLKAMETIYSGPQLAELDLHLRGAGDIFGTKQHGIPLLKVASLTDTQLLESTSNNAETILQNDPTLSRFPFLREKLKKATIQEQIQD